MKRSLAESLGALETEARGPLCMRWWLPIDAQAPVCTMRGPLSRAEAERLAAWTVWSQPCPKCGKKFCEERGVALRRAAELLAAEESQQIALASVASQREARAPMSFRETQRTLMSLGIEGMQLSTPAAQASWQRAAGQHAARFES